jgi:hypothetical protein
MEAIFGSRPKPSYSTALLNNGKNIHLVFGLSVESEKLPDK